MIADCGLRIADFELILYLYAMLTFLVYLIFILTVAMTAGGIVVASRLRNKYKSDIFSSLLYFQVFIYSFGFYGIWGQAIIKTFLASFISIDLLTRFTDISMLLGLPFLVFAWMMLIRFSSGLSGRKSNTWFVAGFLILNFSILVILGYLIARTNTIKPATLIKDYFIVMHLAWSFIASFLIHFPGKGHSIIHDHDRRIIAPAIFLIMITQCIPLFFYSSQIWLALIFLFTFFAGNTFLPVWFSYGARLSVSAGEPAKDVSFEEFCKEYEISPRESDIIREICNGLSNKEISDKLFISLQTVKDHTHRIYIKTNVKSRVQLINLVKGVLAG